MPMEDYLVRFIEGENLPVGGQPNFLNWYSGLCEKKKKERKKVSCASVYIAENAIGPVALRFCSLRFPTMMDCILNQNKLSFP